MKVRGIGIFLLIFISFNQLHAQSWSLTGNSSTDPSVNYIGTSDYKKLQFGTNGLMRMIIDESGSVGIGTITPNYKLDVNGSLHATSLLVDNSLILPSSLWDPSTATNGSLFYNSNLSLFKVYKSGGWQTVLTSADGIQNSSQYGPLQSNATFKIDGHGIFQFGNSSLDQYVSPNNNTPLISGKNPSASGSGLGFTAAGQGSTLYGTIDYYAIQPDLVTEVSALNKVFNIRTGNSFLFSIYGNGGVVLPKDNQHFSIGLNSATDVGTLLVNNKNAKLGLPTSTYYENSAFTVYNWNTTNAKLYMFTILYTARSLPYGLIL